MEKIVIIDDEYSICTSLQFALEDQYDVKAFTEPLEALQEIHSEPYDLCLLDLKLGQINGLEVLKQIKKIQPNLIVIIMTAYGTIETSVEAIKLGAYTYLTKPLHMESLFVTIGQALQFKKLQQQVDELTEELSQKYGIDSIIGHSPSMERVFHLVKKVKDIDTNVLITGESGTGKELVARAIHFSGARKKGPFEAINCAAIPEHLLESELFGFEKGAFTGAVQKKEGKFLVAQNGTVFLDEIGDMPLSLQAKLLRVLQQKEITPLGSNKKYPLNVRIIAATNQNLKQAVEEGRFREDLYFRLNIIEISLPPLRERKNDLPLLVQHFIQQFNQKYDKQVEGITSEAFERLMRYSYPGNVRELSNILEAAVIMCDKNRIQVHDLPHQFQEVSMHSMWPEGKQLSIFDQLVGYKIEEVEKELILATLKANNGHRRKTAEMLGISERGLRNKLNQYSEVRI
jgi:two-component system, NtrC family, response regulator AtoC